MALLVFIAVMLVVGAAVAAPAAWMGGDRRREADAVVLGGAVLGGGVGAVGVGLAAFFQLTEGFEGIAAQLIAASTALPPAAAVAAGHAVLRARSRASRRRLLLLAAVISLGGVPAGAFFLIGGLTPLLAGLCYLSGLGEPRALLRKLDPRH